MAATLHHHSDLFRRQAVCGVAAPVIETPGGVQLKTKDLKSQALLSSRWGAIFIHAVAMGATIYL